MPRRIRPIQSENSKAKKCVLYMVLHETARINPCRLIGLFFAFHWVGLIFVFLWFFNCLYCNQVSSASKTIVNSKCIVKCLQLDCVAACIATVDKNIIGAPQHFSHLLSDILEALVKPIPYRVSSSLGCGLSCSCVMVGMAIWKIYLFYLKL